jgi:metal-sulfur cluster biosynthetic enzyme
MLHCRFIENTSFRILMKLIGNCRDIYIDAVYRALATVKDPEIGEDIVDLGLVYTVEVDEQGIRIGMTMTSPACPMGSLLLDEVRQALAHEFPECNVEINLLWEPAWHPEMMSAKAKSALGW